MNTFLSFIGIVLIALAIIFIIFILIAIFSLMKVSSQLSREEERLWRKYSYEEQKEERE